MGKSISYKRRLRRLQKGKRRNTNHQNSNDPSNLTTVDGSESPSAVSVEVSEPPSAVDGSEPPSREPCGRSSTTQSNEFKKMEERLWYITDYYSKELMRQKRKYIGSPRGT